MVKNTAGNQSSEKKNPCCITYCYIKFEGRRFIDSAPVNLSGCQKRRKIISVHVSNYENGADSIIIQLVNSYEPAVFLFLSETNIASLRGESEQQPPNCSWRMFTAPCSLDPTLSSSFSTSVFYIVPAGSLAPLLSHPFIN